MSAADITDATPIPTAAAEARPALAWTFTVIAAATLVLLLFNAASLRTWATSLEPNAATLQIRAAADAWYDTTDRWGLTAPRKAIRGAWQDLEALTFQAARRP